MIFIFCIRSLLGLPGAGVVVEARQVGGLEALLEGEAMNLKMLLWAEVVGLEFGVVEEVEVEVARLMLQCWWTRPKVKVIWTKTTTTTTVAVQVRPLMRIAY